MAFVVFQASAFTFVSVTAVCLMCPLYIFWVYVKSGASHETGMLLAAIWTIAGGLMLGACLGDLIRMLNAGCDCPAGNAIIPIFWTAPSALLFVFRGRVLARPLDERALVLLQAIARPIGGVFLIECANGFLPAEFAFPAGLGDLAAGALAWLVLWRCRRVAEVVVEDASANATGGPGEARGLPTWAVLAVLLFGMLDFVSAFFFGFTSSDGKQQLFPNSIEGGSKLRLFPTGAIPCFLVPYAIWFHALSWLNHVRHFRKTAEG